MFAPLIVFFVDLYSVSNLYRSSGQVRSPGYSNLILLDVYNKLEKKKSNEKKGTGC